MISAERLKRFIEQRDRGKKKHFKKAIKNYINEKRYIRRCKKDKKKQ